MSTNTPFTPFSLKDIWKSWSTSGAAIEEATKTVIDAKAKMSSLGTTMRESVESKRIKDLASQISSLNMELASAMTDYATKAMTNSLTPVEPPQE